MKNKIQESFNRAWKTYDRYCQIQQSACDKAIKLLLQQGDYYSSVADFACGTGLSTQSLLQKTRLDQLIAIDFCEKLLEVATNKNADPRVEMIHADFDDPLINPACLDLIFCNMGLQWSPNIKYTLQLFRSYLREKGLLVFSVPLSGTFSELRESYRNSFYKLEDLENFINESGYVLECFEEFTQKYQFDTPVKALRSIKAVGANCLLENSEANVNGISRSAVKNIFLNPDNCSLTYRIGIFLIKPRSQNETNFYYRN